MWFANMMRRLTLISGVVLLMILTSCSSETPRPKRTTTTTQTAQTMAHVVTMALCHEVVKQHDTLATDATRADLVGKANTPGVDRRVWDAIVNGLYAGGSLPPSDVVESRYQNVISACGRAGWEQ